MTNHVADDRVYAPAGEKKGRSWIYPVVGGAAVAVAVTAGGFAYKFFNRDHETYPVDETAVSGPAVPGESGADLDGDIPMVGGSDDSPDPEYDFTNARDVVEALVEAEKNKDAELFMETIALKCRDMIDDDLYEGNGPKKIYKITKIVEGENVTRAYLVDEDNPEGKPAEIYLSKENGRWGIEPFHGMKRSIVKGSETMEDVLGEIGQELKEELDNEKSDIDKKFEELVNKLE